MNQMPVLVLLLLAGTANAQYIYLDANGNGVHDTGDRLNANGVATTVDVYLVTNQNRDGSTAIGNNGGPEEIDFFSYVVCLLASDGTVTYSNFINQQPHMETNFIELNPDGLRYKNGYGGFVTGDIGKFRLCTLTVTGVSGSPKLQIVDMVEGSYDYTSFGTMCYGNSWDNTYKLDGPYTREWQGLGDFFDADGLAAGSAGSPTPTPSTPPSTPPATDGQDANDSPKCNGSAAGMPPLFLGIAPLLALSFAVRRFRC